MTKQNERETVRIEKPYGGVGAILKEELLSKEQAGEYCNLFGEVTIEVGATLGVHLHEGETETYYITQGTGLYYDNNDSYEVTVGDVLFCESGSTHGLKNTGSEEVKFIALILKK